MLPMLIVSTPFQGVVLVALPPHKLLHQLFLIYKITHHTSGVASNDISNFIKIQPVILEMKHVEGWTDGWTNQQTCLSLRAIFSCTLGN